MKAKKDKEEEFERYKAVLSDISARCSSLCTDMGESGLYDSLERMESVCNTVVAEISLRLVERHMGKKSPEGWVWLYNTSNYHYFRNGKSLCKRWVVPTTPKFVEREVDRTYNCQLCSSFLKQIKKGSH